MKKLDVALIYCSLLILSFLLILSCCCGHYPFYYYTSLHQSIYAVPAVLIAAVSTFSVIIHSGFAHKKTLQKIFVAICFYISFFHVENYKEYQYMLLSESGILDPISERDKNISDVKHFLKIVDTAKLDDAIVTVGRPPARRGTTDSGGQN